jgi:hypothetical protein
MLCSARESVSERANTGGRVLNRRESGEALAVGRKLITYGQQPMRDAIKMSIRANPDWCDDTRVAIYLRSCSLAP